MIIKTHSLFTYYYFIKYTIIFLVNIYKIQKFYSKNINILQHRIFKTFFFNVYYYFLSFIPYTQLFSSSFNILNIFSLFHLFYFQFYIIKSIVDSIENISIIEIIIILNIIKGKITIEEIITFSKYQFLENDFGIVILLGQYYFFKFPNHPLVSINKNNQKYNYNNNRREK